jgi:bifunctional pyridoxal-dependent enzyme with beta-cystathionase and maltose regulon repressor activities
VRVAQGGRFGVGGGFDRFVRLPFALSEAELSDVVDRLAQAWDEVSARPAGRTLTPPTDLKAAI